MGFELIGGEVTEGRMPPFVIVIGEVMADFQAGLGEVAEAAVVEQFAYADNPEQFTRIIESAEKNYWLEWTGADVIGMDTKHYRGVHLTSSGVEEVEKTLPNIPMIGLVNQVIETGDASADEKINHAKDLFFQQPQTLDRMRSACEALSFVLEPIREDLKLYFSKGDVSDFFNIVNNFDIRHNKDQTKSITHPEQLEWEEPKEQVAQAPPPISYDEYKDINDKYIEYTSAQLEQLTERHTSSTQELDKQIIALAGGGLALTITLAKDVLSKGPVNTAWALYSCWGLFLIALVINMISYRVSAYHYDLMISRMGHYNDSAIFRRPVDTNLRDNLSSRINKISPVVNWLNSSALSSCIAGIILFLIFMINNQNQSNLNGKSGPTPAYSSSSTHARPHQEPSGDSSTDKSSSATSSTTAYANSNSIDHSDPKGKRGQRRSEGMWKEYVQETMKFGVRLPYTGTTYLLYLQPSTFTLNSLRAEIEAGDGQGAITYAIEIADQNEQEFNSAKSRFIEYVASNIPSVNKEAESFNRQIQYAFESTYEVRRQKALAENSFFEKLGISVIPGTSETYKVPSLVKKRIPEPTLDSNIPKKYTQTPELDDALYNDIIGYVYKAFKSVEKKPSVYQVKGEEELRDYLLPILENHYENTTVTGETFNKGGKTDILIRNTDGTNLFVAECKYWKGEVGFLDTINQLFDRYLTWRDSKTALIFFVENKEFSKVLLAIKEVIKKHPYFVRETGSHGESSFSYIFHFPTDKGKHIYTEIMAFHFPK
nr:hypothetical protein [Tanacetum cinerariifolium]